MTTTLEITVVDSTRIGRALRQELLSLCSQAYAEDFAPYLRLLSPGTHVLGHVGRRLVTHAAWVERRLRIEGLGPLRTAYVEAVATLPECQRRGYASQLLSKIPELLRKLPFDLAALAPVSEAFYQRLGWETWRGPLSYRTSTGLTVATPDEVVMIYRLPRTPATLDLHAGMSTDWRPLEVW